MVWKQGNDRGLAPNTSCSSAQIIHAEITENLFFDLLKQITDVDNELYMGSPGGTRISVPDVLVPGMSVAGE